MAGDPREPAGKRSPGHLETRSKGQKVLGEPFRLRLSLRFTDSAVPCPVSSRIGSIIQRRRAWHAGIFARAGLFLSGPDYHYGELVLALRVAIAGAVVGRIATCVRQPAT